MATSMYTFVHPGTIKQGYLVKSPPLDKKINLDGWRKRWCVFTVVDNDPCLYYYKDEEESFNTTAIKRVALRNCYQVVSELKLKGRKNIFALHLPERVYYFSAPSHVEMLEWVTAFCDNLKLAITGSLTLPSTPPVYRAMQDEGKYATFTAGLSSSLPRARTPDSPLPPIPDESSPHLYQRCPSEPNSRPKPPGIPVPLTPLEASCLNTYPQSSPSSSPLFGVRSTSSLTNESRFSAAETSVSGTRIVVSLDLADRPPAPLPHSNRNGDSGKALKHSSDEDEEPLSPPLPPPRRVSPIPPVTGDLSTPPMSPPFVMDSESPPPTPPPRIVGDNSKPTNHYIIA